MAHKRSRLTAAAAAGALLLGLTTSAAQAADPQKPDAHGTATTADPRESTVAPYSFLTGQESVTIEDQFWIVPSHESGRTPAHPGWSITLSDEKLGAGLPRQDFTARARQTEASTFAQSKGFLSIMDQNQQDVPFLVVKLPSRSVTCSDFVEVPTDGPRVFVRKNDGELYEVSQTTTSEAWNVTSATSATDPAKHLVSVKVDPITTAAQITEHAPFQKYAGRQKVRTAGHEIILKLQQPAGTHLEYKILAGAVAVSC
ncbi:hypothetical protein [Lentzea sp. NPDC055074]